MAASALASAAGRPSRVDAERDTTSTFQPPPRNMAMMPTPMVPRQYPGSRERGSVMSGTFKDIGVTSEGHVGIVEIQRPPHNFFDNSLINQIADAFEAFDRDVKIRAYVLCAQGKSFCA